MELPTGWDIVTYEVEGSPASTRLFAFKRYTGRDRLQWLSWQQRTIEDIADNGDILSAAAWAVEAESKAMASRLINWPEGTPVTPQELEEWNGVDTDLWVWLSRTLYAPAYADLESGGSQAKKNCDLLLTVNQEIHRLSRALVGTASSSSTNPGTLKKASTVGDFVPMDQAAGLEVAAVSSASQTSPANPSTPRV